MLIFRPATITDLLQIRSSLRDGPDPSGTLPCNKSLYLIQGILAAFPLHMLTEMISTDAGIHIYRVQEGNIVIGYWGIRRISREKRSWEVLFLLPTSNEKFRPVLQALLQWGEKSRICCITFPTEAENDKSAILLKESGFLPIYSYCLYGTDKPASLKNRPPRPVRKKKDEDSDFIHSLLKSCLPPPLQRIYLTEEPDLVASPTDIFLDLMTQFLPLPVRKEEFIAEGCSYLCDIQGNKGHRLTYYASPFREKEEILDSLDSLLKHLNISEGETLVMKVKPGDSLTIDALRARNFQLRGEEKIWARYSFVDLSEQTPALEIQQTAG